MFYFIFRSCFLFSVVLFLFGRATLMCVAAAVAFRAVIRVALVGLIVAHVGELALDVGIVRLLVI